MVSWMKTCRQKRDAVRVGGRGEGQGGGIGDEWSGVKGRKTCRQEEGCSESQGERRGSGRGDWG